MGSRGALPARCTTGRERHDADAATTVVEPLPARKKATLQAFLS